jgi:hypothetical protein
MCKGTYKPFPCELFVETVVGIGSAAPNTTKRINFLVDTGALDTTISAADATRLGISFDDWRHWGQPVLNDRPLTRVEDAYGIGGKLKVYKLENVYITIISDMKGGKERHTEHMDIVYVADPKYEHESLMGMDLLKRFKLLVDPSIELVSLSRIPGLAPDYFIENL